MSKIKSISVTNLKAVSSMTADFNGCTAIITGANNKGKTSFLRSLADRLRGIKTARIVNDDATNGKAEYELTTGERFIWEFSNEREKLIYVSEKNIPSKVTKVISDTYFPQTFDVDKFLNDTPANQKKVLQKLTGLDFTEVDRAYTLKYEERTYANKRAAEEKIKHEASLPDPAVGKEVLPVDELQKEVEGIEVHNLRHKQVIEKIAELNKQDKEDHTELFELQEKIKKLKEKIDATDSTIKKCAEWLLVKDNQPKTNKDELQKSLESIKRNNEAIKQRELYIKAKETAEQTNKDVKKIEQDKVEMIRLADMPKGFGFDDEGITYNGFAFNRQQLSSSGIYIAALKLALLQIGEVKTLFFDASYLDKNSLAEVEQWAASVDCQLLIERPDFEAGEIKYEIVQQ